jgi:hypothetical protein
VINSSEIYDPVNDRGRWQSMMDPRYGATASQLPDGRILVAGRYLARQYQPHSKYSSGARIISAVPARSRIVAIIPSGSQTAAC